MLLLLAAEAPEAPANPILPTANELFYGAIAFGALYLLVKYVLLPPIQSVRNERAATIKADRDAADAARAQAASASAEVDDQLAGVRAEAAELIDEARAEAEAERQRLLGRAEREVNAMHEIAAEEMGRDREEALASLRPQVADLAVDAASKVLGRPVDANAARPVIDRVMNR